MAEHGLHDWFFQFNARKRQLGLCYEGKKTIALSYHFCELNPPEVVEDTIRHQLAHALVGVKAGHGPVWQAKARELGANPERTCSDCVMPRGKWRAACPSCGKEFSRYRRPKRPDGWYCPACGPGRGGLVWKKAGAGQVAEAKGPR
jgi:predicted SprT family Zn-dependent metalloprotease